MSRRKITCPCGHPMKAKNDDALFEIVRRHVDDNHPEFRMTDEDIRKMITEHAEYDT